MPVCSVPTREPCWRDMARMTSALVPMMILTVILGSCAKPSGRIAGAQGVVLAIRPVPEAEAAATRAVLAALDAGRQESAPLGAARPAAEVLVRDSDGGVISIVEPAAERFRPGESVTIIKGKRPRLVRAGSGQAVLRQHGGDRAWPGIDRSPRKS